MNHSGSIRWALVFATGIIGVGAVAGYFVKTRIPKRDSSIHVSQTQRRSNAAPTTTPANRDVYKFELDDGSASSQFRPVHRRVVTLDPSGSMERDLKDIETYLSLHPRQGMTTSN